MKGFYTSTRIIDVTILVKGKKILTWFYRIFFRGELFLFPIMANLGLMY